MITSNADFRAWVKTIQLKHGLTQKQICAVIADATQLSSSTIYGWLKTSDVRFISKRNLTILNELIDNVKIAF